MSAKMMTKEQKRQEIDEKTASLDVVVTKSLQAIQTASTHFSKALAVGRAYLDISSALNEQMSFVVALAGQANGFKCDKQYDPDVIKRCAIDALIGGVMLTGNQFNIIGGNMYIAQNGWNYKLKNLPGFHFADVPRFDAPKPGAGFVEIMCEQDFIYNSPEVQTYKFKAFVRTNTASTIDNNLGKAKAKLWRALYEKLTGESLPGDDVDDAAYVTKKNNPVSIHEIITANNTEPTNGKLFGVDEDPVDAIKN